MMDVLGWVGMVGVWTHLGEHDHGQVCNDKYLLMPNIC